MAAGQAPPSKHASQHMCCTRLYHQDNNNNNKTCSNALPVKQSARHIASQALPLLSTQLTMPQCFWCYLPNSTAGVTMLKRIAYEMQLALPFSSISPSSWNRASSSFKARPSPNRTSHK
eukprot:1151972-Pelagomonas_calceolata.AAC.1